MLWAGAGNRREAAPSSSTVPGPTGMGNLSFFSTFSNKEEERAPLHVPAPKCQPQSAACVDAVCRKPHTRNDRGHDPLTALP